MTETQRRGVVDATLLGRFHYKSVPRRWRWDGVAAALHGLERRERSVTTDHLLAVIHPDDLEHVATTLESALRAGPEGSDRGEAARALRLHYRVQGPDAKIRSLLVVAREVSPDGTGFTAEGHVLDITTELAVAGEAAARAAVEAAMEGRGAIEQAKGVLMLAYSLSADQAFALLRWWSRNHNLRVRVLAERLMADVEGGQFAASDLRAQMDRSLHDLSAGLET